MSTLPAAALTVLALLLSTPLALTRPAHRLSGPASAEPDTVSAAALTDDDRERPAGWSALIAERFAPGPAHDTTDDTAVRRALRAAARTRR